MEERKQHQPSMTIEEQVENLKSIGLIVNDEEYAKNYYNNHIKKDGIKKIKYNYSKELLYDIDNGVVHDVNS